MGCPPPADAATLVVNTTADVSTGVGCASGCSLREALATAASGDEIVFASPLFDSPQMILLTPLGRGGLGGLEIATNVTINGPGAHLLTVGRPSLAHLDVIPTEDRLAPIFDISTDGVVVLRGMTITGGRLPAGVGGGIRIHASGATVTVEACHITGNRSTAGGGIRADDDLILIDSTVSNNVASASAGGITATFATITIINSTISGNRSVPDVTGDGSVGGIAARDGFILNSTITDNEGGENSPSGLSAQDSSFSLTTVRNSIIAGNRNSSTVPEVSGTGIVSEGSNLIGNPGTVTAFDEPGDQTGVSTADLGLGPLAANGGPTPTHALDMDSLAVDAVLNPCPDPATDQRGVTRPQGTACDIGAFERETGPSDAEHDLAGLKITGPRTVTLTSSKPVQTKTVKVQLQNQGQEAETIPDAAALAALVQVGLTSLDTVMDCADVLGTLDASKLEFPLTLQAGEEPTKGQKLTLAFTVTFDRAACIPDPLKTSKKDPGHEDYRPWASIDLGALGETDSDPTDDMLEGELIDIVDKL